VSDWPSGAFSPWPAIEREVDEPVSPHDVTRRASRHFSPDFNLVTAQAPWSRHDKSPSPSTSPKSESQYGRAPTSPSSPTSILRHERSPSPTTSPGSQSITSPLQSSSGNRSTDTAQHSPTKSKLRVHIPATKENNPLDGSQTNLPHTKHGESSNVYEKLHKTEQISPRSPPHTGSAWTIETGLGIIRSFDGTSSAEHIEDIRAQHIEEIETQHIEDIRAQHIEDVGASSPENTPNPHDGQVESRHASGEQGGEPKKLRIRHRRSSSICLSPLESDKGKQPLSQLILEHVLIISSGGNGTINSF